MMDSFDRLIQIMDTLLSPEGCPWDQKQTLLSLREHLIEEAYEVIEAITEGHEPHLIAEELGDLIGMAVFVAKVAQKEKLFTIQDACQAIVDKLIRRHPHIFHEKQSLSADEVKIQWDQIKKLEKKKEKNFYERIPKSMPSLQKAQEVVPHLKDKAQLVTNDEQDEIGRELYLIAAKASDKGINAEFALRHYIEKIVTAS